MSSFSRTVVLFGFLRHSWRSALVVSLGVSIATAVIVGALLVGDSMRGSLRQLTTERLGAIDAAVIPGGFFFPDRQRPAADFGSARRLMFFPAGSVEYRGTNSNDAVARSGGVQILGIDDDFWTLDTTGLADQDALAADSVMLNRTLADELGVDVGDQITVRLPREGAVPADSPLGRRDVETEGIPRLEVQTIVPDAGLGRFALGANQAAPRNLYIRRSLLGEVLDRPGAANALLFTDGRDAEHLNLRLEDFGLKLRRRVLRSPPSRLDPPDEGDPSDKVDGEPVYDYWSLTSDRLLLPEPAVDVVTDAFGDDSTHRITTYLANAFERVAADGSVTHSVPYSILTATDSTPEMPLEFALPGKQTRAGEKPANEKPANEKPAQTASTRQASGDPPGSRPTPPKATTPEAAPTAAVAMVINSWLSDQLQADAGAAVRVTYFEPEVESGNETERSFDAVVTDVVPITKPSSPYRRRREAEFDRPPTVYNNPNLTPTVPGVTDQASISDWDLPFQLDRKISSIDDDYWNHYRLTPKAFIPLADGQRLFGSRFGKTTGLTIRRDGSSDDPADVAAERKRIDATILAALASVRADLGWSVIRLRDQQIQASAGTTPFDGLFLALSFFVIFSAVMLIAMLFRLGLSGRLKHFGTLMAVGWQRHQVMRLAIAEGAITATAGGLMGIVGGIGYAMFVLWALRNWWVTAVTVPFLNFHATPQSIVLGAAAGWLVAFITLAWTVRSLLRSPVTMLLAGRSDDAAVPQSQMEAESREDESNRGVQSGAGLGHRPQTRPQSQSQSRPHSRLHWTAAMIALLAGACGVGGAVSGGQAAAGGFVGGGMLLLAAILVLIFASLKYAHAAGAGPAASGAASNRYSVTRLAARNASRNPLRSTLTIGLMATAAFLITAIGAFELQPTDRGTGGFNLIAESSQPLYRVLADTSQHRVWFGGDADVMAGTEFVSLRRRRGQDASCNNLYRASQPTVLGVPASMGRRAAAQQRALHSPDSDRLVSEANARDASAGNDDASAGNDDAKINGDAKNVRAGVGAAEPNRRPGFAFASHAEVPDGMTPWALLDLPARGTPADPIPVIIDQNTAMWSLQMVGGVGEVRAFEYEHGRPLYFRVVALLSNSVLQGNLLIGEDNFTRIFPSISGYQTFLIRTPPGAPSSASSSSAASLSSSVRSTLEDRLGDVGMDVSDSADVLSGMLAVQNTYLKTFQSLGGLGLLLGTIGLAVAQMRNIVERQREIAVLRAIGFSHTRVARIVFTETLFLLITGLGCGTICAILAVAPHAWSQGVTPPLVKPILILLGIAVFGMLVGSLTLRRIGRIPLRRALSAA